MKRALWIIILIAAVAASGVFVQRWAVETTNKTVEIVYDLPGLFELSEETGMTVDSLLAELKSKGITTIAIQPESLGERLLAGKGVPEDVYSHLPSELVNLTPFLTLPIAFEADHFELVNAPGLKAAPKLNTAPWDVEPIWLASNPELLIVSGQRPLRQEQLAGSQATIALVEFSTPQISDGNPTNMVRLHGISAREMQVLSDERILNRYMRGVNERNMRVLYVRPFVHGEDSWERSLNLLDSLELRLQNAGFKLGTASPFAAWKPSVFWVGVVGAGIWAGAVLYAKMLFPRFTKLFFWGGLLAYLASLVLLAISPILAKQALALLAAITFPALSIQFLECGKTTLRRYVTVATVSLLGSLFIVATLSGTEFLVKLVEFRGVKLMHVLPIGLVFFTLVRPLKDWLQKAIPVRYLIIAGAMGLAGVLYILRTGNFGIPVPSFEVQVREFLENVLRVRPRTKEFLLGHPALYFALQSKHPQKSWWLPIAVIGQLSLVNTFTHTHTFLWVSLLRTVYGLVFGYLLGWLLLQLYNWGKRWLERGSHLGILRVR